MGSEVRRLLPWCNKLGEGGDDGSACTTEASSRATCEPFPPMYETTTFQAREGVQTPPLPRRDNALMWAMACRQGAAKQKNNHESYTGRMAALEPAAATEPLSESRCTELPSGVAADIVAQFHKGLK